MCLTFFGSSQSADFQCGYKNDWFGSLGAAYQCEVQNYLEITSLDTAQVDSNSGAHLDDFNNDNVTAIQINQGQIHYFPRGLNKIFKNLKGISISNTGLKEIHQSDLKDFPELVDLWLMSNNIEILEENLFEFNPNLDYIDLDSNKISHINPNVFDKLTKLKTLYLRSNNCINVRAFNDATDVQDVIRTAKAQCTSSDYSSLEQKVKNLEIESKNLNSENLKEKLGKLENEIKNSKFPNTFHRRIQDLKAAQAEKAQDEATTATTESPKEPELSKFVTCLALELKIDNVGTTLKDLLTQTGNRTCNIGNDKDSLDNDQSQAFNGDFKNQKGIMEILEENIKNAVKDAHNGLMQTMNMKFDKIEKQVEEQNQKLETIEKHIVRMMRAFYINV